MAAANITNLSRVLTEIWQPMDKEDLFYRDFPFFAKMTKRTDWRGLIQHITVGYGQINGRSATFEDALDMRKPTKKARMNIETRDEYAIWSIDHKFMTLSQGQGSVIVDAVKTESKSAMDKLKRAVGWKVWGNGGGALGRTNSTAVQGSDDTIEFENVLGARRLEEGDVVQFSAADGTSGALIDGELEVESVNTGENTVTFTRTFAQGVPQAVGLSQLYVFVRGDWGVSMAGMDLYVPRTDALATSIQPWGMDRTPNLRRLGGIRCGGKGLPIEQAVSRLLKTAQIEGVSSVDACYLHTDRWEQFYNSLEGKRVYDEEVLNGRVGFSRLEVMSPAGRKVGVYQDPEVGLDDIWGVTTEDTFFHTAGTFPDFLTFDGRKLELEPTANAGQYRSGGYGNTYVKNPGKHARCDLTVSP